MSHTSYNYLNSTKSTMLSESPKGIRPAWQCDTLRNDCPGCSQKFTLLLRRKHHCRACGCLICADCSAEFSPLPQLGYYEPVRICKGCKHDVSSTESESDYSSEHERTDVELPDVASELRRGIRIHSRKFRHRSSSGECFVGSEAVNWLMDQRLVESRSSGATLLKLLISEGLVSKIGGSESGSFQDSSFSFYRFEGDAFRKSLAGMQARDSYNSPAVGTSGQVSRCENCDRSFHSNQTRVPGFCSIDCKTNAEFYHSDSMRARQICT